jgi:hypothetical protein
MKLQMPKKMYKYILVTLLCISIFTLAAQKQSQDSVKHWKASGDASLNFSQVSLTNWSGGGNNSVAGTFLFKGFLNHIKNKLAWDNTLEMGYGLTKQGDYKTAKSEDRLMFNSKLGYENGNHWFYSFMVDLKTQFDVGYKDPLVQHVKISDFMSPGYLQFSLGMDYKPTDNFSLFISPITSKLTIILNDSLASTGSYGVDVNRHVREEYGASAKILAKKDNIITNVNTYTRLDLFSSYTNNPENIDIDWEFGFDMKINKYLNALFKTNIIYDDDVHYVNDEGVESGPRIQVKQLFGAGFTYKF